MEAVINMHLTFRELISFCSEILEQPNASQNTHKCGLQKFVNCVTHVALTKVRGPFVQTLCIEKD